MIELNITFKHDSNRISEALGIDEKRADEIIEFVVGVMKEYVGEKKKPSECIEMIVNNMKSDAEIVYATLMFGSGFANSYEYLDVYKQVITDLINSVLGGDVGVLVISDEDIKRMIKKDKSVLLR
jgi:hypothetical protein